MLEEIIAVLVSPPLISELTKPQLLYSHNAVRAVIEEITQSSIMRLDPNSMDRLWDLITMVFKWQATLSPDIMGITLRHLYEIETYVTNPETHVQLHRVQNVVENFNKIFEQNEKHRIREDVLLWLKNYNIRVSLLLRMGLQNEDGSFVANNTNPVAEKMLKNLGENIYEVTQNGKVLEGFERAECPKEEAEEYNELDTFVSQMLGEKKVDDANRPHLNFFLEDKREDIELQIFDNIDASLRDDALQKIFNELNLAEDGVQTSVNDDLLDMLDASSAAI